MREHSYTIEVQADFLERQAKAKPLHAVAELVWNGLDADAFVVADGMGGAKAGDRASKIAVRDSRDTHTPHRIEGEMRRPD